MLLCAEGVMEYIKKNAWILAMALIFDLLAFKYWHDYLNYGVVHSSKHDLVFSGQSVYGYLLGASFGAAIFSYFLVKTIYNHYRQ